MCGFACVVSKNRFSDTTYIKNKVAEMTEILVHRGPDAEGYYCNDWIALGFKRLSIIDLESRANQPMMDRSGRFVAVYNGEVYNYLEIRKELIARGYSFKTSSDTEVVLNSYIEWNEDCVNRFEGMFSLIIVDLVEQSLFICRDPFGMKPLYYTETKDCYIFVSEVKALLPLMKLEANTNAIYEYMVFRYTISDETLFKNVFRIQPGYWGCYKNNNGTLSIKQYDNIIDDYRQEKSIRDEEYEINEIENILINSVNLHTRCDVEYGTQLSGGVDSSIVTQYVSNIHKDKLHTFSVSFPKSDIDESIYQQEVSSKLSTIHHDLPLQEKLFIQNIEKCLWHYDFPLHDPNDVPFYLLCKMARNHGIKVLLSGDGADELFHGYIHYIGLREYSRTFKFKAYKYYADSSFPKLFTEYLPTKKIPRKLFGIHPIIHRTTMNDPYTVHYLVPDSKIKFEYRWLLYSKMKHLPEEAKAILDYYGYLRPWLTRGDRMAMAASVELRVPFCNTKILKKLSKIPFELKLKDNKTKYLLKMIAQKYFSNDLVWRRKVGFGVPMGEWFQNKNGMGRYLELLLDKTTKERGIYEKDVLCRIITEHQKGQQNHSRLLWNVLNLELWYRIFIDNRQL